MRRSLSSIISFDAIPACAREWLRLGRALLLSLLPFLAFIALVEAICWRIGETVSLERLALRQSQSPNLIWMNGAGNRYIQFKLARIATEKPDVIVIGSSRSTQFRSAMFRPYTFYNAGLTSWTFEACTALLRHLPEGYSPKVILFNLDFFMFHPGWSRRWADASPNFDRAEGLASHIEAVRAAVPELLRHPRLALARWPDRAHPGTLAGIPAIRSFAGFRKDGSLQYDPSLLKNAGRNPNMMADVTLGLTPLFFGDAMAPGEMAKFREFAELARSKGTALVGVQMPIYDPLLKQVENDGRYGILADFRRRAASGFFDDQGVVFFDFARFSEYSGDYRYYVDVIHPTEPVVSAMLVAMHRDPRFRRLLPRLDVPALAERLRADRGAAEHVDLYGYEY